MAGKKKMDLANISRYIAKEEHEVLEVITTLEQFNIFASKLRKDYYENDIPDLRKRAQEWFAKDKPSQRAFYIALDDPDDQRRNDGWGSTDLYGCIALEVGGKIQVVKTIVKNFYH